MRTNLLQPLLILFLALSPIAGCRADGEGPLLQDRFSNPRSGWGSDSQETFDRGYQDGEYFIEVYEPDWFVWTRPHRRFDDVAVEAEVRRGSGSTDGHFGLLCRYRAPGDFYYFAITDDGYYAILRVEDERIEVLTGEGFLPTSAVQTDGATNHIRIVCRGEQLSLYVNGQEVATATDASLQRGDVGLGAGSGPGGSIRVHFDNLVVVAPEGEGP
ncbi:MAG TPA: hypothetical protein EYP77_09935 [Anaerolineae bacterium]|nr:hypothetical protein [Anaerolineae bacterium]